MSKHMQSPDGKITKPAAGKWLRAGLAADGWIEVPEPEKKKRSRAKTRTRFSEYGRPDY